MCLSVCLAALLLGLAACDPWKEDLKLKDNRYGQALDEVVSAQSQISRFNEVIMAAGYADMLKNASSLTVFAPTNDKMPQLDMNDKTALAAWLDNYIANMSIYVDNQGVLSVNGQELKSVTMLNGKNVAVSPSEIVESNLPAANGVVHIISTTLAYRENILDYLMSMTGSFEQIECIKSYSENVMDMDRSVQTGVDLATSQPIYDSVWKEQNVFLEEYPLGDEQQSFTVVLIGQSSLDTIKARYAKYMVQSDSLQMVNDIRREVTADLIFPEMEIAVAGKYENLNGVLVDLDPANIIDTYEASNGRIYVMTEATIKIYENKIKTIIIEGEDYTATYDESSAGNAWFVRCRDWASGGKDLMLKGTTSWTFSWDEYYVAEDSTATISKTQTYNDGDQTSYLISKTNNAYAQFNPTLYSCGYNIYWVCNDDIAGHYYKIPAVEGTTQKMLFNGDSIEITDDNRNIPLTIEQKLLVSFPGQPVLKYSSGKIVNNFSPFACFGAATFAGNKEEVQVVRYRLIDTNNTSSSNTYLFYLFDVPFSGKADTYGDAKTLVSPTYGTATFFVSNTTRTTDKNAGQVFLDYIRLVPLVDVND